MRQGFPRASAVLVLNSYETGYPFACLESSIISAARTAGSAALAAEWLNGGERRVKALGIVGNGLIARYVYTFLMELGWQVDEVLLHDTVPSEAERFAAETCRKDRHRRMACEPRLDAVLHASDLLLIGDGGPRTARRRAAR